VSNNDINYKLTEMTKAGLGNYQVEVCIAERGELIQSSPKSVQTLSLTLSSFASGLYESSYSCSAKP